MSVKMFLMWNSKMLIDGGEDVIVETSLLEASNLIVLRVGPGSVLRGPSENATTDHVLPLRISSPPNDCNVNSSLSFTLQVLELNLVALEVSLGVFSPGRAIACGCR
ncbi:hypothetical protein V8G54_003542, partial [Vigna mungo]